MVRYLPEMNSEATRFGEKLPVWEAAAEDH